ncbi:hypothetical protein DPEC_G00117620 [Dallia pectoralis]|uniref:Uncharacterized protein n=1 Tax=Dallia pectoralis TaxID=75939 RepID=A0ACC2GUW1_DALPE|nr:hypothetical protein DPEC_G00117620 [Dallia pectoralis]
MSDSASQSDNQVVTEDRRSPPQPVRCAVRHVDELRAQPPLSSTLLHSSTLLPSTQIYSSFHLISQSPLKLGREIEKEAPDFRLSSRLPTSPHLRSSFDG